MILTVLVIALFAVFFVRLLLLALRIAWGLTKLLTFLLLLAAIPALIWCVACVGGVFVLAPLALLLAAFGVLKLL